MGPPKRTPLRSDASYAGWICALLLLAIALIYGQTLTFPLLSYDDSGFVTANSYVNGGFSSEGIWWALTAGPYGEWYPLAPLSHMLDCQVYGLHAWGHHLTNVLLHAATSLALFLVLWRMTAELWPSAFVAALFAVHPQHVESVAWVSERRDVLSGLFFVLTLGAWLGYVRQGRLGRYALALALYALSLMAKPMVVTLPCLLFLLDFWPLARCGSADAPDWTKNRARPQWSRLLLEKLPFFALAAADCLLTLRTHGGSGLPRPLSERAANALVSCVSYVVDFFYPLDLATFYPHPLGGQPLGKVASAAAILLAVSAAAVFWRRRCPYLFVGWFWFLGMLSPVLGLINVSAQAMADRYMYLPGIGLYIALTWSVIRWAGLPRQNRSRRNWLLATAAGLVLVALIGVSIRQASYWRDDTTLWTHSLACTADNADAELALADALRREGRLDEAADHYRLAVQFPTDRNPFNHFGSLLFDQGKIVAAVEQYRLALAKDPDSYMAHVNLAVALERQNQIDEAVEHFHRAMEIDSRASEAYLGLAHLLASQDKIDEATATLQRAIDQAPRNATLQNDLAATLVRQGKIDEAIPHYLTALTLDPNFVIAHVNLADALRAFRHYDEAAAHYGRALELDPQNAKARAGLDKLLGAPMREPNP